MMGIWREMFQWKHASSETEKRFCHHPRHTLNERLTANGVSYFFSPDLRFAHPFSCNFIFFLF